MSVDNEELVMEVAELRKDNEQLRNELGYWRQQAHDTQGREKHNPGSEAEDADRADEVEVQLDTRKSLEGAVRRTIALEGWSAMPNELGVNAFGIIMNLLDRQAAVTARECANNPEGVCRSCRVGQARRVNTLEERNGKLRDLNRKLEDELDVLRGRFDLLRLFVDSTKEENKYLRTMLDSRERELKLLKAEDDEWALVPHDSLVKLEGDSEELEKLRNRYENLKHSYARSIKGRVLSGIETDDGGHPGEHDTETDVPDSREKLEGDVSRFSEMYAILGTNGSIREHAIGWLDRQAAITRAECEAELVVVDWWTDEHGDTHAIAANGEEVCHYVKGEHAEAVNKKIAELEAELNRTCSLAYDGKWFTCSECGESLQWFGVRTVYKTNGKQERALGVEGVRFCPFCGSRIEMDGDNA